MADVNVPGLGSLPRWGVYAIAIGGGGVLILLWRNHEKAQQSAASNATATPAAGGTASSQGTGIDPATGYPYGSAEDQAALESQAASEGSGSVDPLTGLPYGSPEDEAALAQMYEGESVTSGYGAVPTTGTTSGESGTYSNNAAWTQAAVANLTALGYNDQQAATAIALYLANQSLNASQAQMVQVALAETGPPPTGTYSITQTATGTGSTGTTGSTGAAPGAVSGIAASKTGADSISVDWKPATGAASYNFAISPAPKGGSAGSHNIGARTQYNVNGIQNGTTYTITVQAVNTAGNGPAATYSYKGT